MYPRLLSWITSSALFQPWFRKIIHICDQLIRGKFRRENGPGSPLHTREASQWYSHDDICIRPSIYSRSPEQTFSRSTRDGNLGNVKSQVSNEIVTLKFAWGWSTTRNQFPKVVVRLSLIYICSTCRYKMVSNEKRIVTTTPTEILKKFDITPM